MGSAVEPPKVLLQYEIVDAMQDGRVIRETHRWIIPGETPVSDIIEHVDNSPTIDRESVRIFGAEETDEF